MSIAPPSGADAPPSTLGLRHLALWVADERFGATVRFYREGMGMQLQWQPDDDNVYLTSGRENGDNLALHRVRDRDVVPGRLDHLGFCMANAADVQRWRDWIEPRAGQWGVEIVADVKTHRDGATSFYLRDPAGTTVQLIHIPLPD